MRYDCHGCIFSFGLVRCCIVLFLVLVGERERGHRYPALHHARRAWLDWTCIRIDGKMIFVVEREGQRRNMYIYLRVVA